MWTSVNSDVYLLPAHLYLPVSSPFSHPLMKPLWSCQRKKAYQVSSVMTNGRADAVVGKAVNSPTDTGTG